MTIEVAYLISFVFGISGFIGVWYGMSRNRKHDSKQDATEQANIAFELKALQKSLMEFKTEMKLSIEANGRMTLENHDKIIKLEADMKTAFIRIDEIRGLNR